VTGLEIGGENDVDANSSLTIAIPFYRGLEYLESAIESVLAQNRPDWRLFVFDDSGQIGEVGELLGSYADPRVAYHRNERNLGMVPNWNRCIDRADTDLVALLHADDRLEPDYVDAMLELAGRHPDAAAYFCEARIIDSRGRTRFSFADATKRFFVPGGERETVLRGRPAVRALMRGNFIMCPTLCFRKSALGTERFSGSWEQVQDLEFTTRLLMQGKSLVGTARRAYAYRRHEASATSRQSESLIRFDEEFRLFDQVAARAEELGWSDVARISRGKAIVRLHLLYRIARDAATLRPTSALEKLRFLLSRR
jgi:glycosyltransferase involved in cell wall biosynthesis